METISIIIFVIIMVVVYKLWGGSSSDGRRGRKKGKQAEGSASVYPDLSKRQNCSIFRMFGGGGQHAEAIYDKFSTLDDVRDAVRKAGLESCSLIFGIDFTSSNIHQGRRTNNGRSLHNLDINNPNPYQMVMSVLGETLESFDHDGYIPAFGFGDASTRDFDVFPFLSEVMSVLGETLESFDDDGYIPAFGFGDVSTRDFDVFPFLSEGDCFGFHGVLDAYNQIAQRVRLAGPTNFAPVIHRAIDIVKRTGTYHILVIVADGQVTSERATKDAIVEASKYPISIILVGVGDGPWDMMEEFDDALPTRKFDNFQFVDYHKIMASARNPHAAFALSALMEIPDQYKKIKQLGYIR